MLTKNILVIKYEHIVILKDNRYCHLTRSVHPPRCGNHGEVAARRWHRSGLSFGGRFQLASWERRGDQDELAVRNMCQMRGHRGELAARR